MQRRTGRVAIAALAGAVAALALLLAGTAPAATRLAPAPDFALTLLDGSTLHLADLKGKPVFLTFWWSK